MKNGIKIITIMSFFYSGLLLGQSSSDEKQMKNDYYSTILPYEEIATGGAVMSRMIDGLGFRYFWATDGLREKDLNFRADTGARASIETIIHIYDLSKMIKNASEGKVNERISNENMAFEALRSKTLENLKIASENFRAENDSSLSEKKILIKRSNQISELPFWNLINGPVADCIWHTGQIVLLRRLSGNPFSDKVNLLTGTVR